MRNYDDLTKRGQAKRLRDLAKSALLEFEIPIRRLEFIKLLVNTTFRLRCDQGHFLVRVHREVDYTLPMVQSELDWLRALSPDSDLVVQTPCLTPDGRGVVMAEARGVPEPHPVTVLSWIQGRILPQVRRRVQHYEALGRLVARLHAHSQSWSPPPDFHRPTHDVLNQIGAESAHPLPVLGPKHLPPHILEDMEAAYEGRRGAEEALGVDNPTQFGLIHCDLSFSNILFRGGEAAAIDFDMCGFGFYVYDLGVALTGLFSYDHFTERCAAVFRGYRQIRPIPTEWIEYLPAFMASRTASYILRVVDQPDAVRSQWRSLLRPLLQATPDDLPA